MNINNFLLAEAMEAKNKRAVGQPTARLFFASMASANRKLFMFIGQSVRQSALKCTHESLDIKCNVQLSACVIGF